MSEPRQRTAVPVLAVDQACFVAGSSMLVENVSLEVEAGEVMALLGPNGAGKSTLLKMASGELTPSGGRVLIQGTPIAAMSSGELAARRAVVSQLSVLAFPFTARQVVELGATVPGFATTRPYLETSVTLSLSQLGLLHLANRSYLQLSGGERQRVHVARALCQLMTGAGHTGNQPLLLLDEPTTSLDIAHQRLVLDAVRRVAGQGAAVLVVLHDVNLAAAYADRMMMMRAGRALACGTPRDIVKSEILSEAYDCRIDANCAPAGDMPFALPVLERRQARGVPSSVLENTAL